MILFFSVDFQMPPSAITIFFLLRAVDSQNIQPLDATSKNFCSIDLKNVLLFDDMKMNLMLTQMVHIYTFIAVSISPSMQNIGGDSEQKQNVSLTQI